MNIVVFDLEWNIAGYQNKVSALDRQRMTSEIIEIGAVKLDAHFQECGRLSLHVKPQLYRRLFRHVARVTRRAPASLRQGIPFPDALRHFKRFCGKPPFVLASWSNSDGRVLLENLRFHQLEREIPVQILDVQLLYDRLLEKSGMQRSIEHVLDALDLPKPEPFHTAVSDAAYTGRILAELATRTAPRRPNKAWKLFKTFLYNPNLNHSSRFTLPSVHSEQAAVRVARSHPYVCPACGQPLARPVDWHLKNGRLLARLACAKHGPVSGRIKIGRRPQRAMTLKATLCLLTKGQALTEDSK